MNCHLFYQNVRGLRSKTDRFYVNALNCDYDIVCLTETWLNSSVLDGELFNDDYFVYRRDRSSSSSLKNDGGGSLISVKASLVSERRNCWESDAEDIWVSVQCPSSLTSPIHICCVLSSSG